MKSFAKAVFVFFDSVARARAASTFVRMGRHDLAKQIMLRD